jgi:fatty-acyl-CoA synthase
MNDPIELDWLDRWAAWDERRTALVDVSRNRRWTYGELFAASCRLSRLLAAHGVRRGDRVAALAGNDVGFVPLFFATARLGAVLVPVNFRLAPREIDHVLEDASPRLFLVSKAFTATAAQLAPVHAGIARLAFDELEALSASHDATPTPFEARFDDACMVLYTSGTTGAPKGAVLTHQMLFWNSVSTGLGLDLTSADVTVSFLPFFHVSGWHVLNTPFLHRGATIVFLDKFDPARVLEVCAKHRVTVLFGVPTTMDAMARAATFSTTPLDSVRFAIVGGEPMSLELIKTWQDRGVAIRQGFGMTEVGPNCFSLDAKESVRKIGSIGRPNFYVDARLVRDDGTECGVDEVGELLLRGPAVTPGYWRNERATAEAIREGWFHTGDLLRRDAEGFFFVAGRKKDMFITGGENVYPVEIERVLSTHPKVREVAVIGVPDAKWGEVGRAFVAPLSGESLTEAEVLTFLAGKLARYKIPRSVVVRPELPKSDSGKILKRALKELP